MINPKNINTNLKIEIYLINAPSNTTALYGNKKNTKLKKKIISLLLKKFDFKKFLKLAKAYKEKIKEKKFKKLGPMIIKIGNNKIKYFNIKKFIFLIFFDIIKTISNSRIYKKA